MCHSVRGLGYLNARARSLPEVSEQRGVCVIGERIEAALGTRSAEERARLVAGMHGSLPTGALDPGTDLGADTDSTGESRNDRGCGSRRSGDRSGEVEDRPDRRGRV